MALFVLLHRWLDRLGVAAVLVCVATGLLSLVSLLVSMWMTGDGGAAFRWLRLTTHQPSWPLAVSAGTFDLFMRALGAALLLHIGRWIARRVLLVRSDPALGIVTFVSQTGMTINQSPVMRIGVSVEGPRGPVATSVTKSIDLGNMPRRGDRVRVRVSRDDPTCVAYHGLA